MNEYTFWNPETVRYWGEHKRKAKDLDHLRKFLIATHTPGKDSEWRVCIGGKLLGAMRFRNDEPFWIPMSWNGPEGAPRRVSPKTGKLMGRF